MAKNETPLYQGSRVKTWAGASQTVTSGSEAAFYSPAAIPSGKAETLDFDVSIVSLKYEYTFPGFDPAGVDKSTMLPYLGFYRQASSNFHIGISILPYPGSAEETEIERLPTREASPLPIEVNIAQKGPELAWKSAFGFAWEIDRSNNFGFSILFDRDGVERKIVQSDIDLDLQSESRENTTIELQFGYRWASLDKQTIIASSLIAYGQETVKGTKKEFGLTGDFLETDLTTTRRRPIALKVGITQELDPVQIVAEIGHARWKDVSQEGELEYDYFNVTSFVVGMGIKIDDKNSCNFAYGSFPTHIGDGIIGTRAEDGREIQGVRFGDLNGVNLQSISIGFTQSEILYDLNYYVNFQSGEREVFEDAVYYGDHSFQLLMFGAGGSWKI